MHKMMDDRALVRNLSACETMGSATTICSDKTGTLTMNLMTVVSSWVYGKLRNPTEMDKEIRKDVEERLFASICLNTNGHVGISPLGAVFDDIHRDDTIICVDTFNSTKKRMGVVIQEKNGGFWVHWKGASEVLLKHCSRYMDSEGNLFDLTSEKMDELEGIIVAFANAALRTLCFACKELSEHEVNEARMKKTQPDIPDKNLTCIAIVGIKDPLRPGVMDAVQKCQVAGIKVRMVTGDNLMTAKAIAMECGILREGGVAIEGKHFREMEKEEQYKIIPSLQVMARSSPTDKHTLVKRLLEMGDIVAVTGDGTNDAPALHEASIGLAMGIAGTEVAKESADIIILDDNFASIVKVVRWGRSVYSNIQKFIQFQCTVNGVALALNFIAAIANGNAPLTAVQLLWVNLIMDTMGALALATEPPNQSLMNRPPVNKKEPLITNIMWRNMIGQFIYQLTLLLVLQFRGKQLLGLHDDTPIGPEGQSRADRELETVIFNAFVFCQVILIEICGSFTSTVHLSWHTWLLCIALGAVGMPLAVLIKCIPVPTKPMWSSWQQRDDLVFREGGSVMSMMLRQGSQKVDLQRTRSVKSTKFYTDFSIESGSPPSESDSCFQRFKKSICPIDVSPSVTHDTENPNKRNSNEAWR